MGVKGRAIFFFFFFSVSLTKKPPVKKKLKKEGEREKKRVGNEGSWGGERGVGFLASRRPSNFCPLGSPSFQKGNLTSPCKADPRLLGLQNVAGCQHKGGQRFVLVFFPPS